MDPFTDEGAPPEEETKVLDRTIPSPDPARSALVNDWQSRVTQAREHWEKHAFKAMREDMAFAKGAQWAGTETNQFVDDPGDRYVANIVLRHVHQRTATIYGKNPKIVARRKKRLMSQIWDGTWTTLQSAMQMAVDPAGVDPITMMPSPQQMLAMQLVQEAQAVIEANKQADKMAETLEILFEHEVNEQPVPFKVQMKATVRRTLTTGVGYVKAGYQRIMKLPPEIEAQMRGAAEQLAALERLAADVADGEVPPDGAEAERLRLMIQDMSKEQQVLVREGLMLTYPHSTALIPDLNCQNLRGWVGASWVAEQYWLTADKIQEIWKRDIKAGGRVYVPKGSEGEYRYSDDAGNPMSGTQNPDARYCVWEIYCKDDGLVYVLCDGFPDFLVEPSAPDVWLERFWPWFVFLTNEVYDENTLFPPSDVRLLRDPQLEINRARQGLREHRRARRPMTLYREGVLEEEDKSNLRAGKAHSLIGLKGMPDGMRVSDALEPMPTPAIDPNVYDTTPALEDVMRVVGQQEANLGGTSGATATETGIAEASRSQSASSVVDDLDEFLTDLCRTCGMILFGEMQVETVKKVVGPGAVWPELDRETIAQEILLDIEAGSSGRPNKAAEVQNAMQLMPLLFQIPGVSPEWAARELIRRLDDRIDLTDAFAAGMPSMQTLNGMKQMQPANDNGEDPNSQGNEGGDNAKDTAPPRNNAAPTPAQAPPMGTTAPPQAA